MNEPDILTAIDRWFDHPCGNLQSGTTAALMRRARDEIVALRANTVSLQDARMGMEVARAEALEEAARLVERVFWENVGLATQVRALKEKGYEDAGHD